MQHILYEFNEAVTVAPNVYARSTSYWSLCVRNLKVYLQIQAATLGQNAAQNVISAAYLLKHTHLLGCFLWPTPGIHLIVG